MPKHLDLIEVMAQAMLEAHGSSMQWAFIAGGEQWRLFEPHAQAALAALEEEGHVVTKLREPLSDADISSITGIPDALRGAPNPLAPGAPAPQQSRFFTEMATHHGISHPQEPFTPEPRKEES